MDGLELIMELHEILWPITNFLENTLHIQPTFSFYGAIAIVIGMLLTCFFIIKLFFRILSGEDLSTGTKPPPKK